MRNTAKGELVRQKICIRESLPHCDMKASAELLHAFLEFSGWFYILLNSCTLLIGFWFGSWADKYGPKKLMFVPLIGSIFSTVNFIVSSCFMSIPPMFLMPCAVVEGLTSHHLGISCTCYGIVSEVNSYGWMSLRMAIMEISTLNGIFLGCHLASRLLPMASFIAVFSFELSPLTAETVGSDRSNRRIVHLRLSAIAGLEKELQPISHGKKHRSDYGGCDCVG